jgi:hypothetical protein
MKLKFKKFMAILGAAILAVAGFVAYKVFFARQQISWDFVRATGGCRVGDIELSGKDLILPVFYDISGLTTVTRRPEIPNSMSSVHGISCSVDASKRAIFLQFSAGNVSKLYPQESQFRVKLDRGISGQYTVYYVDPDGGLHEIDSLNVPTQ